MFVWGEGGGGAHGKQQQLMNHHIIEFYNLCSRLWTVTLYMKYIIISLLFTFTCNKKLTDYFECTLTECAEKLRKMTEYCEKMCDLGCRVISKD